jgi:hypothetical protein
VPAERLQIRYEDTTLPGYFFRAPDAEPGDPRPLVGRLFDWLDPYLDPRGSRS